MLKQKFIKNTNLTILNKSDTIFQKTIKAK